jgi:hypothetical protein
MSAFFRLVSSVPTSRKYFLIATRLLQVGIVCKSYDIAARLAASIFMPMLTYSGYMIPVYAMKQWL